MTKDGVIILIFNEGLNREALTNYFGGKNFNFSSLKAHIKNNYSGRFLIIESKEQITTTSLESILKIAGLCLKDASAIAKKDEFANY
ncbi:MAG: hypothetical protein SFT93_03310 [Rickettsiaceae bacterium]|nr:hypothetical protein [Rickettsiaceae bacterium]